MIMGYNWKACGWLLMAVFNSTGFAQKCRYNQRLYRMHLNRLLRLAGRFILAIGDQGNIPAVAAMLLGEVDAIQGMHGSRLRMEPYVSLGTTRIPGAALHRNMAVIADAQDEPGPPAVQQQEVKRK